MTKQTPHIISLEEIDSTNNFLKELKSQEDLPDFTYVKALYQTAGKGQRGNFWEAERTQNLLFSLLLRPTELPITKHFLLSEIVSLALVRTLEALGADCQIKWPNDIYWGNKKIAGILIENDLEGNQIKESVVGIGLNVNQTRFSDRVPNPSSLQLITRKEQDLNEILVAFDKQMKHYFDQLKDRAYDAIANEYQGLLFRADGFYIFRDHQSEFKAKIESVAQDGTLCLLDESNKKRTYLFKEVQFVI